MVDRDPLYSNRRRAVCRYLETWRNSAGREALILKAVAAAVFAGLLIYSQTVACFGDEGFHLLAAQLIRAGRKPYVDFFYQHPPLYAYLTAGWMAVFGDSWRSPHVMSAMFTALSAMLAGSFVFSRFAAGPGWRLAAGILATVLIGTQPYVVGFGTIGQPYGFCLFCIVAAFRLAVATAGRSAHWAALWSGVCAGAAAASSLLTAPVALILILWLAWQAPAGQRGNKCAHFATGAIVPFLPVCWLALQSPGATFFEILQFHISYRGLGGVSTFRHDLGVVEQLLETVTFAVPGLLAAMALLLTMAPVDSRWKQELYLCALLMTGLGLWAAFARPTFPQYFVWVVPFLSILAATGACGIGARVWTPGQAIWPGLLVVALFAWQMLMPLYHADHRNDVRWKDCEAVARYINRVTPKDGSVYSDTLLNYFAARRLPPPGLESEYAPALPLPSGMLASLHIVPQAQLDQWLAAGHFDTVCMDVDESDKKFQALHLLDVYAHRGEFKGGYHVYWGRRNKEAATNGSRAESVGALGLR